MFPCSVLILNSCFFLTLVFNLPGLLYSPKPSLYPLKLSQTQYLCLLWLRRNPLSAGAYILIQGIVLLMTWLNAGVAIWHLGFFVFFFLISVATIVTFPHRCHLLLDYTIFNFLSLSLCLFLSLSHIKCLSFLFDFPEHIFFLSSIHMHGTSSFSSQSTYQGIYLIKYYFLF